MAWWNSILLIPYCIALGILILYGFHRYYIVKLYYQGRHRKPKPRSPPDPWPIVTVQLPIYNERYVVERLIRSVARMDYPKDRFEIQVLDDSTDDTSETARACVEDLNRQGYSVVHIRRGSRKGFKAGALIPRDEEKQRRIPCRVRRGFRPFPRYAEEGDPPFCGFQSRDGPDQVGAPQLGITPF